MKVFVSHARSDAKVARQVAAALRAAKQDVWMAEESAASGSAWLQEVATALQGTDAIVALISPAWVDSEMARREMEYAITTPRFQGRFFPVVIEPTSKAPWVLKRLALLDVHEDVERGLSRLVAAINETESGPASRDVRGKRRDQSPDAGARSARVMLIGGGAAAVGEGARAASKGGVIVGGSVHGDVSTGGSRKTARRESRRMVATDATSLGDAEPTKVGASRQASRKVSSGRRGSTR